MTYKALFSDVQRLLSLPETGMGYQIFEARRPGKSRTDRFLAYNSDLILDFDISFAEFRQKVMTEGYSKMLERSEHLHIETQSIFLFSRERVFEEQSVNYSKKLKHNRNSGEKGANESTIEYSNGKKVFVRLSAFEKDKRVDFVNKRLREGSFTTTDNDYILCLTTNDDPVDRYALANDDTIKWAFYIRPTINDPLQRGVAQPAFGHDGGGIEVYFEMGTSANTYLSAKPYGKWQE